MRKLVLLSLFVWGSLLPAGHAAEDDIPLVSLNENGKEVVKYVPRRKFIQGMAQMLNSVQEEALPALARVKQGKQWWIRTFVLGIGVDIKLGGTFFEFGITPRFKAFFSNSKDPVTP